MRVLYPVALNGEIKRIVRNSFRNILLKERVDVDVAYLEYDVDDFSVYLIADDMGSAQFGSLNIASNPCIEAVYNQLIAEQAGTN